MIEIQESDNMRDSMRDNIDAFSRSRMLLGAEGMERLKRARVAVFGLGGVGGYIVEALTRSGVGELDLIDPDRICFSNLNRQILATRETIGRYKTDVARERIKIINPDAIVRVYNLFFLPETADNFDFTRYDYIADAIDTVTGKLELITKARDAGTPIISSMGAGNKLDASALEVADIYQTSICPLARVMRRELKKRGIKNLKVVYSKEVPMTPIENDKDMKDIEEDIKTGEDIEPPGMSRDQNRRSIPGSVAFVPAAAGLIMAGEIVRDLLAIGD